MVRASQGSMGGRPRRFAEGNFFGVPVGDLGWFTSLIMSVAVGFAAFFLATFAGIVTILLLSSTGHRGLDYAWSYRRAGLPVGLVVMALAMVYLGSLWVRRQLRRG